MSDPIVPFHHWTPHRVPEGYENIRVLLDAPYVTLRGCTACGSVVWNVVAHNALCEYGKGEAK